VALRTWYGQEIRVVLAVSRVQAYRVFAAPSPIIGDFFLGFAELSKMLVSPLAHLLILFVYRMVFDRTHLDSGEKSRRATKAKGQRNGLISSTYCQRELSR
jgi:hypothetical protein